MQVFWVESRCIGWKLHILGIVYFPCLSLLVDIHLSYFVQAILGPIIIYILVPRESKIIWNTSCPSTTVLNRIMAYYDFSTMLDTEAEIWTRYSLHDFILEIQIVIFFLSVIFNSIEVQKLRGGTHEENINKWKNDFFRNRHLHVYLTDNWVALLVLPGGSDCKESACNTGDVASIPRLGRSPGKENGYPLQCSCVENFIERGAWLATVHGVPKSQKELYISWLSQFSHMSVKVTLFDQ